MLGFIPMFNRSTIYKQTVTIDAWGQRTFDKVLPENRKCQISYNIDLSTVSGNDGETRAMSATILFHGRVDITVGDKVEFTDYVGITGRYDVGDVFYFEDYAGKIIATRVVVGNGKRS